MGLEGKRFFVGTVHSGRGQLAELESSKKKWPLLLAVLTATPFFGVRRKVVNLRRRN